MFHPIIEVFKKFKPFMVAEIPADVAACEFDCRELDCTEQDWQNCPQRKQKADAIRSLKHND